MPLQTLIPRATGILGTSVSHHEAAGGRFGSVAAATSYSISVCKGTLGNAVLVKVLAPLCTSTVAFCLFR